VLLNVCRPAFLATSSARLNLVRAPAAPE